MLTSGSTLSVTWKAGRNAEFDVALERRKQEYPLLLRELDQFGQALIQRFGDKNDAQWHRPLGK